MTKGHSKKHGFPKFAVVMTVGFLVCLFFAVVYYMAYFSFEADAAAGTGDLLGSLGLIFAFAGAGTAFLAYAIYLSLGAAVFLILASVFFARRI